MAARDYRARVAISGGIVSGDEVAPNRDHPLRRLPTDERNTGLGDVILRLAFVSDLMSDQTQENQGELRCRQPSPCGSEHTSA
jgi:hypothetical protein